MQIRGAAAIDHELPPPYGNNGLWHQRFLLVMAGLVPAIHVFLRAVTKTWMPGTRPGMTRQWERRPQGRTS